MLRFSLNYDIKTKNYVFLFDNIIETDAKLDFSMLVEEGVEIRFNLFRSIVSFCTCDFIENPSYQTL